MIGSCSGGSFIPSLALLKCFHLWRNFQRIPRSKFNAISLLNPAHVEHILVECEIDDCLIITVVSEESPAEKCGIRNGDVIECLNGKRISNTVELENMLLSIMEKSGDNINSDLDLEIQVYFTRTELRRIKVLTVNVSEDGEYCEPYMQHLPAGNLMQHFTK
uniref:PDZ domain-containing protein n=1 Tax=Triticum urartu TaxID=4572 RepID=A0A8R7U3Q8_TRIUA